ncbi:MAG: D-2-hydroxyacid dehydrogenase [Bacillota bacterium]
MIRIAVSGIPRGFHFPHPDGNWLQREHREQILSLSGDIELLEIPAHRVGEADLSRVEVLLAEGGNRSHYRGELDWEDYQRFFVPSLRWVQLCSTGFRDNVTPQILDGSVILTNIPGLHTLPIAESVLAAMLAHAKNFRLRRLDQRARCWRQRDNDEMSGRTVLIIGLGSIGRAVARLCRSFGMRVLGTRRRAEPVDGVDTVFAPEELATHLPEADYIVMAVPLTDETEGMLAADAFAAMKRSAYLVNVGRGGTVDGEALLNALREGQIAGAYLDVFDREPLPLGCESWDIESVFIVPHDSHSSPRIGDRVVDAFCRNLQRYLRGDRLMNVCDPRRGY